MDVLKYEDDRKQVFLIQARAQKMYGSIRGLSKATGISRKVMDRAYLNGLASLIPKNMLRLCYALRLTPNQFYGFEPLPEVPFEVTSLNSSERIKVPMKYSFKQVHDMMNKALFNRNQ